MKALVYALFVVFAIIMVTTFYVAHRVYDGLVEPRYYERGRDFFTSRERDESMGLAFHVPEELRAGANHFSAGVTAGGAPLQEARAELFVGNVSTTAHDAMYTLQEEAPGRYGAELSLPVPGGWVFRLELRKGTWETSHRWSVIVR